MDTEHEQPEPLGPNNHYITKLDLSIRLPEISPHTIHSLSFILYFPNLTALDICYQPIGNNYTETTQLPHLKKLIMVDIGMTNSRALARCTQLEELDISYNPIRSVGVIGKLVNLKRLGISDVTSVKDFSPLGKLTSLEFLDVSASFYRDYDGRPAEISIEWITNLRHLKEIDFCSTNNVISYEPLLRLEALEKIHVDCYESEYTPENSAILTELQEQGKANTF
jgi:Leucine-rich repeat (LRR) protein